jgi:hypothetical protein
MSGVTASGYAWFEEEYGGSLCLSGFCLTFARDLSPEETFCRIGVTAKPPGDPGDPPTDYPITAYAAIGGTVLLEENGYAGTLVEVTRRLSAGTVTAAVFVNVNADQQFVYAADGRLITGFEPDGPDSRWGADPDRLLAHMRELGMPTEEDEARAYLDADPEDEYDPIITALALAERATGVRLTADHLTRPALTGSAGHLY